jgi:Fe-S-cluster containining protein
MDYASVLQLAELNRQVERGSLFTQATLQRGFERLGEAERLINTLTMALIAKGLVTTEELGVSLEETEEDETEPAGAFDTAVFEEVELEVDESPGAVVGMDGQRKPSISWPSVAVRVDGEEEGPPVQLVDCAARMHVCHAVCCRLKFPLSGPEIDSGLVKWDIGHPYIIRQGADGRCVHNDGENGHCDVYENRPGVCRRYTCFGDKRIWKDFDNMVLNQEWIDEHVGGHDLHVHTVLPNMHEPEVWDPNAGGEFS